VTSSKPWVIVLAAGEGTRISALTRDGDGRSVPKQYWAPEGGRSMLHSTLRRAGRLSPPERILTVVAEHHRRWWAPVLGDRPPGTVLRQPANRGTAVGILFPLLRIHEREADALVAILPSDHHVSDEEILEQGLRRALVLAEDRGETVLLGITPDRPDGEYGWILCGQPGPRGARRVASFVEKPPSAQAASLQRAGALWSSFILAGRAEAILSVYEQVMPDLLGRFARAAPAGGWTQEELARLYADLPPSDFSRDVLQRATGRLLVVSVPACGWTDLGTPQRFQQWRAGRSGGDPARARELAIQGGVP
jgi:mannose-1-phosphate guanylyltransferase